jgi:hypothetical protein
MKGHKPGGGIASRQHVEKGVRYGQGAMKADLRGVSQIGESMGSHITEKSKELKNVIKPLRSGAMGGMGSVPLGNQIAGNVGSGGPGKGRTLYGQAGSQGQHGAVASGNPRPKGELFPGWPAKR